MSDLAAMNQGFGLVLRKTDLFKRVHFTNIVVESRIFVEIRTKCNLQLLSVCCIIESNLDLLSAVKLRSSTPKTRQLKKQCF